MIQTDPSEGREGPAGWLLAESGVAVDSGPGRSVPRPGFPRRGLDPPVTLRLGGRGRDIFLTSQSSIVIYSNRKKGRRARGLYCLMMKLN